MKKTKIIMGMTIIVEVLDISIKNKDFDDIFNFFSDVDSRFSTYKENSEIMKIGRGEIKKEKFSRDVKEVFLIAEKTKKETQGYFDIYKKNVLDPSGIVKGWAIQKASDMLRKKGFKNFYVNAGGDVQTEGGKKKNTPWKVGIKNPFNESQIVKVINLEGNAVATSGTYIRGQHIYNPHNITEKITDIVSMSVVSKNILDADRFATAAFAMGKNGIAFIESMPALEGYVVDKNGIATYTAGFQKYL